MIERARGLLERPDVAEACRHIVGTDAATVARQIELAQVPAPTFDEGARADVLAGMLEAAGATDLARDEVGNVLARVGPVEDGPPFVLSAHLDTVFPRDTDLTVVRRNGRLVGPGITDDARGLAVLVSVVDAMRAAGLAPARPTLVAGTVGEEGAGDLRGGWHLFREGGACRDALGFVSLDGAGLSRIVSRGLGCRRLRATVRGPGGHSWLDRTAPNPIHVLGGAVEALARMPHPESPTTTVAVTRWGGGRSVNAIPAVAWVEMDLRSESSSILAEVEAGARRILHHAMRRARAADAGSGPGLRLTVEVIGSRPAGRTPPGSLLLEAAVAATRTVGHEPELVVSSTDANVPMHLGIDAVTLGGGGRAGAAHTAREWYANQRGADGVVRALLTTLLMVGTLDG